MSNHENVLTIDESKNVYIDGSPLKIMDSECYVLANWNASHRSQVCESILYSLRPSFQVISSTTFSARKHYIKMIEWYVQLSFYKKKSFNSKLNIVIKNIFSFISLNQFEVELSGSIAVLDSDLYLINSSDWSEELATFIAFLYDIELSEKHWVVIYFAREFYIQHNFIPSGRSISKLLREDSEIEWSHNRLIDLFKPTTRFGVIAGLPQPHGHI